jgi:pimeloyl-ACP methyl ester carboxylesterase
MPAEKKSNRAKLMLAIALVLILIGGIMASLVQTNGCSVKVRDVRFTGTNGVMMSALLYVPDGATNKNPAPGILCIHGYFNSREQQGSFAIELARRGYVVLALDQSGHGYSDPPVGANAFGGPDGLKYLSSLDIVDKNNIGMEGHSMGGWAIGYAASIYPDSYKSMVLIGSGTGGVYGVPDGTTTWPRNLCVILTKFDEFSAVMWGSFDPKKPDPVDINVPSNVVDAIRLKAQFGTNDKIQVGKLYGSIANGTGRVLYQPPVIHPADMQSTEVVGDTIDWFDKTLKGAKPIPASNQTWPWKETGTFIALIGMILLIFPLTGLLLSGVGFFRELAMVPSEPKSAKGVSWWISAIIFAGIPAAVYFSFTTLISTTAGPPPPWKFVPNGLFPQPMTNELMVWVLLLGAISAVLFLVWHLAFNRKAQASAIEYGLSWGTGFTGLGWMKILKSFLLALTIAFIAYLTLVFSAWFFGTDFRIWVLTFKPMSLLQFRIFLSYLVPFTAFFIILSMVMHAEVRPTMKGKAPGMGAEMLINIVMLVIGFIALLVFQYVPLLTGGHLALTGPTLETCLIYQLLPVFAIVALVSTYLYRKTGHIYAGAFLLALLVTWSLTAGQAIGVAI